MKTVVRDFRTFFMIFGCILIFSATSAVAEPKKAGPTPVGKETRQQFAQYQQQIRSNPNDIDSRAALMQMYLERGLLEEAQEQADEVLRQDRRDTRALLSLARIAAMQQDWKSAKVYYQRLIALDKNNASAYLGLGQAWQGLGNELEADAAFQKYRDTSAGY